jgi:hypothetical protein
LLSIAIVEAAGSFTSNQTSAFLVHTENNENSYFWVIVKVEYGLFSVHTIKYLEMPMNCLVLIKHVSKLPMMLAMQY